MWETLSEWYALGWVRAITVMIAATGLAFILERYLLGAIRVLTRKTATDLDDVIVAHLKTPLVTSAFLLGLAGALQYLGWARANEFVVMGVLKTIAVMVWATGLQRAISAVLAGVGKTQRFSWVQARTTPILEISTKTIVFGGALYAIFLTWDLDLTGWLASAGIVGVAVGFAAKDTLANLFAGLFILADAPYKVGDTVVFDDGTRGNVTDIGVRSTRVLTRDHVELTVPNALIANGTIRNESGGGSPKTRLKVPLSVAYGSNPDQVKAMVLQALVGTEYVARTPEPRVRFTAMGDSSLNFEAVVWLDRPEFRDDVIDEANTRIYNALTAAGLEIPFPQSDVHVRTLPPGADR